MPFANSLDKTKATPDDLKRLIIAFLSIGDVVTIYLLMIFILRGLFKLNNQICRFCAYYVPVIWDEGISSYFNKLFLIHVLVWKGSFVFLLYFYIQFVYPRLNLNVAIIRFVRLLHLLFPLFIL